jgi:hypothetical protein
VKPRKTSGRKNAAAIFAIIARAKALDFMAAPFPIRPPQPISIPKTENVKPPGSGNLKMSILNRPFKAKLINGAQP